MTMHQLILKMLKNNPIAGIQARLAAIEVNDTKTAQLICTLIPAHCPFERRLSLWGVVVHIPPLCQLNPFYKQLIALRLKALVYLDNAGVQWQRS
jgi:hypothetical protein